MKFISLLLALLIIGFLATKQLGSGSSNSDLVEIVDELDIVVPEMPSAPNDIQTFENDVNDLIQNAADKRRAAEAALND